MKEKIATGTGKLMRESDAGVLPEWASVPVTYGRSFRSAVRPEKGAILYVWEARAFYAGGAAPTPEIQAAARKSHYARRLRDHETLLWYWKSGR